MITYKSEREIALMKEAGHIAMNLIKLLMMLLHHMVLYHHF